MHVCRGCAVPLQVGRALLPVHDAIMETLALAAARANEDAARALQAHGALAPGMPQVRAGPEGEKEHLPSPAQHCMTCRARAGRSHRSRRPQPLLYAAQPHAMPNDGCARRASQACRTLTERACVHAALPSRVQATLRGQPYTHEQVNTARRACTPSHLPAAASFIPPLSS